MSQGVYKRGDTVALQGQWWTVVDAGGGQVFIVPEHVALRGKTTTNQARVVQADKVEPAPWVQKRWDRYGDVTVFPLEWSATKAESPSWG